VVPLKSKLKLHSFDFSTNLLIVFSIKLLFSKISDIFSLFISISSLFNESESEDDSEFEICDLFLCEIIKFFLFVKYCERNLDIKSDIK